MGYKREKRPTQLVRYPLIGAVEGNQELRYFTRLKVLIEQCVPIKKLVVEYEDTGGSTPLVIAKRAQNARASGSQKISAVFDHDNKDDDFTNALLFCNKNNILPAYSNLNLIVPVYLV